jgi:hypothetical protein
MQHLQILKDIVKQNKAVATPLTGEKSNITTEQIKPYANLNKII